MSCLLCGVVGVASSELHTAHGDWPGRFIMQLSQCRCMQLHDSALVSHQPDILITSVLPSPPPSLHRSSAPCCQHQVPLPAREHPSRLRRPPQHPCAARQPSAGRGLPLARHGRRSGACRGACLPAMRRLGLDAEPAGTICSAAEHSVASSLSCLLSAWQQSPTA